MSFCKHWMSFTLLFTLTASLYAAAPTFPTRPIRLVAPFPPGGGTDILARTIAQKLSESMGQQVIVDNRPGATGIIGTEIAKDATPDGYTILMGNAATHAVNVSMFKRLPYHPLRDFELITQVARLPEVLVVHPSLPANSVKELIALAKAKPGQLNFGSAGVGSPPHLAGEIFKLLAKIDIVHVPYKGSPPALADLMGGQINMYFSNILTGMRLVKTGKLKALGVSGAKRSVVAPELPTIAEAGLPGYEEYNWYVIAAPKGTPREIVRTLNTRIVEILKSQEVAALLTRDGAEVVASTPEECVRFVQSEIKRYAKVIHDAKLKPL